MNFIFPRVLDSKTAINVGTGTQIIDLLQPSMKVQGNEGVPFVIGLAVVDNKDSGRADSVTTSLYASIEYTEVALKYNGVCNPFRIDEGEIFFAYDIPSATSRMRSQSSNADRFDEVRKQYLTPEKKSTVDPLLKSFDKRTENRPATPKTADGAISLPPNLAQPGETELTVEGGKIVFGANVSKTGREESGPVAKSDYIAKLIKNRLR